MYNRSGIFSIPETLTGNTSSAAWTSATYNTINNQNDDSESNWAVEVQADNIIDFTEGNPFGELGNKGSSI